MLYYIRYYGTKYIYTGVGGSYLFDYLDKSCK